MSGSQPEQMDLFPGEVSTMRDELAKIEGASGDGDFSVGARVSAKRLEAFASKLAAE
jgi:hypothetical protein